MSLLLDAFAWLGDPAQWAGTGSIPARLAEHLAITVGVVVVAAGLAIPIGVAVGHTRRGQVAVVAVVGAARAVPTLGLLTGLALLLGIGVRAPVVALVVLAVPSVLAGCYAGIQAVDALTVDASRAVGMSEAQVLARVELPLAAPVVVGGLRAATLQVVATATLAAYTADLGLGRYLFAGLKSGDYAQMLGGALLVTALALLLELALAGAQRAVARRTRPEPSRRLRRTPTTKDTA
ncbi:ABC transporter permease subunit [Georgenia wangjunii]|uniref:ABC transporter permease subunit n=1 Tax=Georgenia wangjunii TaxID=3117730 RepID=UPI002F2691A3